MNVETIGHAGLLLRDDQQRPLLVTDPWLRGSCYWRSWWLQHYPDEALVNEVRTVAYCYITHEHPDHFHTASIRLFDPSVQFLTPDLPHQRMAGYLAGQGRNVRRLPPLRWHALGPAVRILSIPLVNDDSALIVETPEAVLIDLNDSKPRRGQVKQLAASLDRACAGKRRVLLSSYSPASIVNSFIRGAERVSLRQKPDYVRYVCDLCALLRADDYLPFASQVIFRRTDSAWANEFKVTFDDLQRHWSAAGTRLLPPYTRLDLRDGAFTSVPPDRYNHDAGAYQPKVEAQQALDEAAVFSDEDVGRLQRKLNHGRWLFALLFPTGIGFALERGGLHYDPWRGTVRRAPASGDFVLRVPAQAFKEAVQYGHFADMGTTMFTIVTLNGNLHPRRVYLFFMIMALHDYGHTVSVGHAVEWLRHAARLQQWRIPAER